MSRMEAGGAPQPLQLLSAAEMVAAALQRIRPRAGTRRISLNATDPDPTVLANPALFELVLINILDNAILYSDDEARIEISIAPEQGSCRIDIADTGQGIPDASLRRVFERFYRAGRSENTGRGSGLGLAIAKGFVEALGGTIDASTPGLDGLGTRITIRLPLAEAQHA
jgi:two-component system, OmpR family, sensor histidine kinase KdpD